MISIILFLIFYNLSTTDATNDSLLFENRKGTFTLCFPFCSTSNLQIINEVIINNDQTGKNKAQKNRIRFNSIYPYKHGLQHWTLDSKEVSHHYFLFFPPSIPSPTARRPPLRWHSSPQSSSIISLLFAPSLPSRVTFPLPPITSLHVSPRHVVHTASLPCCWIYQTRAPERFIPLGDADPLSTPTGQQPLRVFPRRHVVLRCPFFSSHVIV